MLDSYLIRSYNHQIYTERTHIIRFTCHIHSFRKLMNKMYFKNILKYRIICFVVASDNVRDGYENPVKSLGVVIGRRSVVCLLLDIQSINIYAKIIETNGFWGFLVENKKYGPCSRI